MCSSDLDETEDHSRDNGHTYKQIRIEQAKGVIGVKAQISSHNAHRSLLDTNTGFIDVKADASVLLEEEEEEEESSE